MNKNISDKINDAKNKTNVRKVSKEKDPKSATMNNTNSSKIFESSQKGKNDLSEEIYSLIAKMNHSDWQKRKDAAESVISMLN